MFIFEFEGPLSEFQKRGIAAVAGKSSFVNFILFTLDERPHLCIFKDLSRYIFTWRDLQIGFQNPEPKDAGIFFLKDGKYDVTGAGGHLADHIDREEAKKWRTWLIEQDILIIQESWEKFLKENTKQV